MVIQRLLWHSDCQLIQSNHTVAERSLSENVKWGTRKRFMEGKPNGRFRILGYEWQGDELVIVPEEAVIIKRIFDNFLAGK